MGAAVGEDGLPLSPAGLGGNAELLLRQLVMQNNALREEVSELRGAVEALGGERAPASGCVRLAPMP